MNSSHVFHVSQSTRHDHLNYASLYHQFNYYNCTFCLTFIQKIYSVSHTIFTKTPSLWVILISLFLFLLFTPRLLLYNLFSLLLFRFFFFLVRILVKSITTRFSLRKNKARKIRKKKKLKSISVPRDIEYSYLEIVCASSYTLWQRIPSIVFSFDFPIDIQDIQGSFARGEKKKQNATEAEKYNPQMLQII